MKKNYRPFLISAIYIALNGACNSGGEKDHASVEKEVVKLSDVFWLEGKWQDIQNGNQWEVWESSEKGLYGRGMYVKEGDTSLFEEMSIRQETGALIFTAFVRENDRPVEFTSTSMGKDYVVFENPEHDFPKRIYYSLESAEENQLLQAEVSAGEKRLSFTFKKVR